MVGKRWIGAALVMAFASSIAVACSSEGNTTAAGDVAAGQDAVIEEHAGGTVAWTVSSDGKVQARVAGNDGKPIQSNLTGTLAWKATADAEAKTIPLDLDAKTGVLAAAGPKLEADITEVGYTLTVAGKPWSGTLHLPPGGTAELVASAKASAELAASVEGKLGPHGGTIQIVGDERFEIVADDASGEVRVYLLDADLKAIAIGDRAVTLAVVADKPEIVVLAAAEGGLYLKGKWGITADPTRITIAARLREKLSVAIVGFKAGAHLAVGAKAPSIKVRVKAAFDAPDVDLKASANANAKAKVQVDVPDVNAKVKVKAPDLKVKAPDVNVKAGANAGAGAKAKAGAGAKAKAGVSLKLN